MTQDEFTNVFVESEAVGARAERENQKGRGRVQAVGGGNQVGTRLEGVRQTLGLLFAALVTNAVGVDVAVFVVLVDTDDGTGWDTSINIGGSVKWVKHSNVTIGFGENGFLVGG